MVRAGRGVGGGGWGGNIVTDDGKAVQDGYTHYRFLGQI